MRVGAIVRIQEVAYDAAGRLTRRFEEFCAERRVPFRRHGSVRSYDDTTLFCPAGMQRLKPSFRDPTVRGVEANLQECLRLNDLDELGDGRHLLRFGMLGLFSFRKLSVGDAVGFWADFLEREDVRPERATVHPDRMDGWAPLWERRGVPVVPDPTCTWSDGGIGGYCTELHVGEVEIGNVVNPLGDCIDAGFGLERILLLQGHAPPPAEDLLRDAILAIAEAGHVPGPNRQGSVLRSLIRRLDRMGGGLDHPFFRQERERRERLRSKWLRLRGRFPDRPREWWLGTHGIDPEEMAEGGT